MTFKQIIKNKIVIKGLFSQYVKLKLMIQLRALHGEIYLHALLRLIDLAKSILTNSIENGQIAHISDELSVDMLPQSFRYYDPIIMIVKKGMSEGALEAFDLKQKMNIDRSKQISALIKKALGDPKCHQNQYPIVKQCNERDLNPVQSRHSMGLQSSRYLSVHLGDQEALESKPQMDDEIRIDLEYCLPRVVNLKNQQFLNSKGNFLAKIYQLKSQGIKIQTLIRLQSWINLNQEYLFENMDRSALQRQVKDRVKFKEQKKFQNATYQEKQLFREQLLESIEILLKHKYMRKNDVLLRKIKA